MRSFQFVPKKVFLIIRYWCSTSNIKYEILLFNIIKLIIATNIKYQILFLEIFQFLTFSVSLMLFPSRWPFFLIVWYWPSTSCIIVKCFSFRLFPFRLKSFPSGWPFLKYWILIFVASNIRYEILLLNISVFDFFRISHVVPKQMAFFLNYLIGLFWNIEYWYSLHQMLD